VPLTPDDTTGSSALSGTGEHVEIPDSAGLPTSRPYVEEADGATPDAAGSAEPAYQVKLPAFEGPLDLLLHLIRINEMDIFDIPIVEIARQYQAYLEMMRRFDLEVAGEYILMAATLMHIKSKMLLPRETLEGESAEEEDPRADLTRQLVEYQRIKQGAENLQALESVRGLVWMRGERVFTEFEKEEMLVVDLFAILGAMKKVLDRLAARERFELRTEEYSVPEKVEWLTGLLAAGHAVSFVGLISSMTARGEIVATFLAVLELMRMRRLVALQKSAFDDILLAPRPEESPLRAEEPVPRPEEPAP
jgi:segregation and condensation protein A